MPRRMRYILPQLPHHTIQRGNNKQDVFFDKQDRRKFLANLKEYCAQEEVFLGAYCLMTNHFHLLLYPRTSDGLIHLMKHICQLHTQFINRKYKRTGKLWENRYKLNVVDPDSAWILARYIERNPLRAKMVNRADEYVYSSARAHLAGEEDGLLTQDIIQDRRTRYQEFFYEKDASDEKHIAQIRAVVQQGKVFGKDDFIAQLEEKFKVNFRLVGRGRPKKKGE